MSLDGDQGRVRWSEGEIADGVLSCDRHPEDLDGMDEDDDAPRPPPSQEPGLAGTGGQR